MYAPGVAIAIKQAATWDQLLGQWQGQGWSQIRNAVLSPVPVGINSGQIMIPTQADAFEWKDVTFFGIGNTDDAVSRLQQLIQQGGSKLHAYALFKRVDVDVLGVKVVSYRLLLYHSIVQLGVAAVVILVVAFAALIYLQYVTTGQPPVTAIKNLWSGIVQPVQDGVTGVVQSGAGAVSSVYILGIIAAGAIAIAFGQASKATGTKVSPPKGPSGSVGVRAGGVSARIAS